MTDSVSPQVVQALFESYYKEYMVQHRATLDALYLRGYTLHGPGFLLLEFDGIEALIHPTGMKRARFTQFRNDATTESRTFLESHQGPGMLPMAIVFHDSDGLETIISVVVPETQAPK